MEKRVIFKSNTRINIGIAVCALAFLLFQILIAMAPRIGLEAYSGVILAFQFAACLLMVRIDYRKGFHVAVFFNSISILFMARAVLVMHRTSPIPGLFNTVIYFVALTALTRQFRRRDKEAVTDVLTGLLNRRGLYKLLKRKIEDRKQFSVIYVDLGNFKMINDNYGHVYGDSVMKMVASRMGEIVGKKGTIARMGGDEFVVVIDGDNDIKALAQNIIDELRKKTEIHVGGSEVKCYLTAFAGISSYPNDTDDFESLIKYADIAMYEAARNNCSEPVFFDKVMETTAKRQIELEKIIKEGLEKGHFYLNYQPQYKIEDKKLRGFEALLRIKTEDGTPVSPAEFIPVAEKSDLIMAIDDYVLKRAMREIAQIDKAAVEDVVVSVNVSAKNMGSADFAERVIDMVKEAGISASNLEVEITEYCLVQSVDVTIDNIKRLREYGIQVALDDFGTGYTSLSYLFKMPINLMKIDKSLIDEIENNDRNRDFVKGVIEMGHLMGCEVISEGVETQSQIDVLRELGDDLVQGFVWGRPVSFEEALRIASDNSNG